MTSNNHSQIVQKLNKHSSRLLATPLASLIINDQYRFNSFSRQQCGLLYDFSKEKLDQESFSALVELAKETALNKKIKDLFDGKVLNVSENRPALHMAWRADETDSFIVNNKDITPDILQTRTAMLIFAEKIRDGIIQTAKGETFTDIVNIGIGGSDLSVRMAIKALEPFRTTHLRFHFIANVDGADISDSLRELNPETTLCIIASKSFTTKETMMNAKSIRRWYRNFLTEDECSQHFVAATTNQTDAENFGISTTHIFPFQQWVGGRYSIWSPVGMALAMAIGREAFCEFLQGARQMDQHFITQSYEDNLPVIAGLLAIWRRQFMNYPSTVTVAYDNRMILFIDYLQQLIMESNGKSICYDGSIRKKPATAIQWGGVGSNAQHSFFQYLHQSPDSIPVDFLIAQKPIQADDNHHNALIANCLAQSMALAIGKQHKEDENYKGPLEGDTPSTLLVYPELTPNILGKLLSLYEHRTFVEATILNINPFDQWGVELGKALVTDIESALQDNANTTENIAIDPATQQLINYLRKNK